MNISSEKPLGIIGAMRVEVNQLQEAMHNEGGVNEITHSGKVFCQGTINGVPVVVVQCGVGMVNSALCAQILIDRFNVAGIVNTGIAGSLDASINIGDIVVATDAVNHIMDVQNLGYLPGQTPGIEEVAFPTSSELSDAALKAASELGIPCHTGRIASGDRFVREPGEKQRISRTFNARCCEMEGAALAQACFLAKVPYLVVRAISDKADGSASVDYPTFESKAAHDCAALTIQLIKQAIS